LFIESSHASRNECKVATYLHTEALVATYVIEMNTTISVTANKKIFPQSSCWSPLFPALWQFKLIHLLYPIWRAYHKKLVITICTSLIESKQNGGGSCHISFKMVCPINVTEIFPELMGQYVLDLSQSDMANA